MAIDSNTKIRLVGTQSFAYATGNSYTQGHVHFTTDEHGSIVVNGKVYGTTDASYVYYKSGDKSVNMPTYVANTLNLSYAYTDAKIKALDGNPVNGTGSFVYNVSQEDGKITAYKNTLQGLVNIDDSQIKAYTPKGENEIVKFIKSLEIEGDTIIPKWDYFTGNVEINIQDKRSSYSYIPTFTATRNTITIKDGTYVASYEEFKGVKDLVYTFFKDADKDAGELNEYIDTLEEIQNAFKNSYAEGISKSIKDIQYNGGYRNNTYSSWITYTTNGGGTETAYVDIPIATKTNAGLVKYDDITIKKNTSTNQLYVNGQLTDTKYSLYVSNDSTPGISGAYINLTGSDNTVSPVKLIGTGIATVSYNSSANGIVISVPETVVNYNHHTDGGGTYVGSVKANDNIAYIVTGVNLSPDGTLSYKFSKLEHGNAGFTGASSDTTNIIPIITVNNGHVTNITTKAVDLTHDHEEFYWL